VVVSKKGVGWVVWLVGVSCHPFLFKQQAASRPWNMLSGVVEWSGGGGGAKGENL
jgi:glycyl-tRNA synthetase alpha subunit